MRSAVIIKGRKNAIFVGKGYVFTIFAKGCRCKKVRKYAFKFTTLEMVTF